MLLSVVALIATVETKIPMGMTGKSWLHHFGSITQSAMKKERGIANNKDLDHPGITVNYK
jgi:hypothetical protein